MSANKNRGSGRWAITLLALVGCFSPTGSAGTTLGTTGTGTIETTGAGTSMAASVATTTTTSESSMSTETLSTSSTGGAACGDGQLDADEECDDGALADGDGCAANCLKEYRRVFVTSTVFTGDLGGIAGADAKCQAAADSVMLSGIFRAWISTEGSSPETTFVKSKVRYIRVDDVEVAADWEDLIDGQLKASIFVSELGGLPGIGVHPCGPGELRITWTNTRDYGSPLETSPCGEWSGLPGQAVGGIAGEITFAWTQGCQLECMDQAALYCFEQ